ncbi:MAG: cation:proton antiporter [Anaerolineales bacterium]|jgi:Kef-type K+ transport system membrane component KefB
MEESLSFAPLLIVLTLAFVVPMVLARFKKLRLPIVVGELIAGIIVGRSGFGWVAHHDPVLDLLGEFGFVFLMFLSGMEIDFSNLGTLEPAANGQRSKRWGPIQLGITSFLLTLALSIAIGYAFYHFDLVKSPWMMALILSTTSLGVVVPVLKEKGISTGSYGQSLLVAALIADFATMFLITVLVAVISSGLTLDILLIGVLFVAFFFMYRFGMFFFNRLAVVRRTLEELSSATAQIKVRAAFTMMLVFVALSETIGTEIILGAFLAGAIISLLKRPEDDDLEDQLNAIGFGFFIPIFFIMVGVDFNLAALAESSQALILAPLLILAALAVKFLPGLVFRLSYSWRQTWGAGVLLSARLSLIIAASAIGMRLGIITESVNSAIVLVSLITVSFVPALFSRIIPSPGDDENKLIMILGAGELGNQVAENLKKHHDQILVVADNPDQRERVERRGTKAIVADTDRSDPQLAPYFEMARSVVCVYSDPDRAYHVCKQARTTYGIDNVVARVDNPQDMARFENIGVVTTNAAMDRAALLAMLARNSLFYYLLTRREDDKDFSDVTVSKTVHFGQKIRNLNLPGDIVIVGLKREGQFIIPTGDTKLEKGDRISLLGNIECIRKAEAIFN